MFDHIPQRREHDFHRPEGAKLSECRLCTVKLTRTTQHSNCQGSTNNRLWPRRWY